MDAQVLYNKRDDGPPGLPADAAAESGISASFGSQCKGVVITDR